MMAAMSGLSAPSRRRDDVAVETESDSDGFDEWASVGAIRGIGGRSLLRTAVGGRARVETFERRRRFDCDRTLAMGGADNVSASSS